MSAACIPCIPIVPERVCTSAVSLAELGRHHCRSCFMSKTIIADLFAETLHLAGVERIYGVVGDSLNGLTDSSAAAGQDRMDPCPQRGGGRLRGGCRGAADRQAGGMRGIVRSRQHAPDQRAVRLQPDARAGAGDRGAGAERRRSARTISRRRGPEALFRECSVYCETISDADQMPRTLETAIRAAVGHRGVSVVAMPGDVALALDDGHAGTVDGRAVAAAFGDDTARRRISPSSPRC